MRVHKRSGLTLALALAVTGCATSSLDLAPHAPDIPWTPATRADGEIVPGKPAPANAPRSEGYVLPANTKAAAGQPQGNPATDTTHAYTLAELIDLAESHNPSTRMAWESARDAALATGIIKAAYLPNLSASVVGAYQSGNNTLTTSGVRLTDSSPSHGSLSALSIQWLLFDFGERDGRVSEAEQGSIIANIAFTAVHQQVIYRVSLAYYARAAAVARLDTTEKALQNAKDIEAAADARQSHGVGTSVEVAQARQARAQAQLAEVQARGQLQDAYTALIAAMGFSPLSQLRIAELTHRKLSPSMSEPIEQIVSDALARRPDVLSAYAAHEASLARLKAAKAEFLPKVFMSATGSYSSTQFNLPALPGFGQQPPMYDIAGRHWGGTVILGVTVPVYDGGVRRALEEQARDEEARSNDALERVRDEATREVVRAGNGLETSLAALDASQALTSASQITFDAALDAYRNGVGSITEATRAQTALLEANNAATDAYSGCLISAATLALSLGTLGSSPE